MVLMDKKALIINKAGKIGIDIVRFTSCEPFLDVEGILDERSQKGYLSGFEEKDIKKRIDPALTMEGCRTIISAGISYNTDCSRAGSKEAARDLCSVSRCSWGIDYHRVLKDKLEKLSRFLEDNFNCRTQVFVDTGPFVEREVAKRAGLGFVGKNCFVINPEFGSFIFIGEILTDMYVMPDNAIGEECGDCTLCLKACPTGALCAPYTVNAKKCISYLTQCKDIKYEDYKSIGNSIYGCDVCQRVCPKNKNAKHSAHEEFIPEKWNVHPDTSYILGMDKKAFEDTFKKTSSGWRGRKNLQRNALIALGNSRDKQNAAEYIVKALQDERGDIRETAVYAIYNLIGSESFNILMEHLNAEKDEKVRNAILKITGRFI
jgi:Uncharacterized Fe-S protein